MVLLLFDIDGTLVTVNGAGRSALTDALSTLLDTPISTEGISFSGRTDPDILRSVLSHNGHEPSEETLESALNAYVTAAREAIQPQHVQLLPGVQTLLRSLARREDVHLALVTGNVEPIAYHKLDAVGLSEYFSLGAFGSDHADRDALPPLALRRARRNTGHPFARTRTIIIGDTDRDVQCAKAAGVRSVAVCTGGSDRDTLAASGPDVLLADLTDLPLFEKQVLDMAGY
jgi:phosphoglycolate phosphatase-like HAD superfamily hydrolase